MTASDPKRTVTLAATPTDEHSNRTHVSPQISRLQYSIGCATCHPSVVAVSRSRHWVEYRDNFTPSPRIVDGIAVCRDVQIHGSQQYSNRSKDRVGPLISCYLLPRRTCVLLGRFSRRIPPSGIVIIRYFRPAACGRNQPSSLFEVE